MNQNPDFWIIVIILLTVLVAFIIKDLAGRFGLRKDQSHIDDDEQDGTNILE